MKQIVLSIASMLVATLAMAQPDFHAGQAQMPPHVEPDFKDINYAGDDLEAHRLDIYLPKDSAAKHKASAKRVQIYEKLRNEWRFWSGES